MSYINNDVYNYRGHCLLFSTGSWQEDGQFAVSWASQAYCNYTIFVGVLIFVISAIQIYRLCVFSYKGIDRYGIQRDSRIILLKI